VSTTPRWVVIGLLLAILAGAGWFLREEIGVVSALWENQQPSQIRVQREEAHRFFAQGNALLEEKRYEEAARLFDRPQRCTSE
jgi:hypothetical protein